MHKRHTPIFCSHTSSYNSIKCGHGFFFIRERTFVLSDSSCNFHLDMWMKPRNTCKMIENICIYIIWSKIYKVVVCQYRRVTQPRRRYLEIGGLAIWLKMRFEDLVQCILHSGALRGSKLIRKDYKNTPDIWIPCCLNNGNINIILVRDNYFFKWIMFTSTWTI